MREDLHSRHIGLIKKVKTSLYSGRAIRHVAGKDRSLRIVPSDPTNQSRLPITNGWKMMLHRSPPSFPLSPPFSFFYEDRNTHTKEGARD